jgi:uncharacterized protein YndB with AHSA1/START domain
MSQTIKPAPIVKSFTVPASPQKAFSVFTDGHGDWWPKTHSIGDSPLRKAVIEPRANGRWYGLLEDGTENMWGDVLVWEPPSRLVLAWRISGQWAYDPKLLTEIEVRFTPEGEGVTRVDFEHRNLERLGEGEGAMQIRNSMDSGWGLILDSYIAATGV